MRQKGCLFSFSQTRTVCEIKQSGRRHGSVLSCNLLMSLQLDFDYYKKPGYPFGLMPGFPIPFYSLILCHLSYCHRLFDLDTKCGVKRNNLFAALKAKVFCRELNGIFGLIGFHIDL